MIYKRLAECRKSKGWSQKDLAAMLDTSHSVIGKYERGEMTPSIEAAKKIARLLDTTVSYLLDETQGLDLFKDRKMLERFIDLNRLPEEERQHAFFLLDALLRDAKTRTAYAQ